MSDAFFVDRSITPLVDRHQGKPCHTCRKCAKRINGDHPINPFLQLFDTGITHVETHEKLYVVAPVHDECLLIMGASRTLGTLDQEPELSDILYKRLPLSTIEPKIKRQYPTPAHARHHRKRQRLLTAIS